MKAEEQRVTYTATQATTPTEWPIVPFEQVATPQSDRGKRIKQRDYLPEGRIPVIDQGQTLIGGYTNDEDFAFLGELPVVLFGDHTRAVKLVDHRFAVGADGIKIFRPAEGVRPKYLYYWMKSARIPDRGYGRHYQYLRQLSVPFPPPNKQDEIVAEIEKQFSRLDEAVANLKRVKANLKHYKAAVLKAAVEGRLVETEAELARREGRSFETGAQLLQRILETCRSQWKGKGKYKEPAAPDTTDLPELPEGWVWASVQQLSEVRLGKMLDKQKHKTGNELPYLRNINVRWGSVETDNLLTMYFEDDELDRYGLRCGDVLVCEGGEPGRAAVWDGRFPTIKYQKALHRVRFVLGYDGRLLVAYLEYLAKSGRLERWFTGSTIKHFTGESFASLQIPLPPIAEQGLIIEEIERLLSLADEADAQVNANVQRAERLRQSILSNAFTGNM